MSTWIIEPRDPLIVRDGRPFGPNPGARATSLPFPFPSTLAGAIRTRIGVDPATGKFDAARLDDLKKIEVRGPLLVELDATGDIPEDDGWLVPAPADVLLLKAQSTGDGEALCKRLCPLKLPATVAHNLDLPPVGLARLLPNAEKGKPHPDSPRFWRWSAFQEWLIKPTEGVIPLDELGHSGPERESRMHVSMNPQSQTGEEGALFQTSGLEFARVDSSKGQRRIRSLALAMAMNADSYEGVGFLGGERRIGRWRKSQQTLPSCPQKVREAVSQHKACRVILVTPGYFDNGYLPSWMGVRPAELGVEIMGVAMRRYQVVSGWDYAKPKGGEPKPTRRLVPSGAVYFLKFSGDLSKIGQFIDSVWMQPISDVDQFRRDGFGMAVVGTWDGELTTLEMTK